MFGSCKRGLASCIQRQVDARKPVHCQRFSATGRHADYVVIFMQQLEESQESQRLEPGPDAFATQLYFPVMRQTPANHSSRPVLHF